MSYALLVGLLVHLGVTFALVAFGAPVWIGLIILLPCLLGVKHLPHGKLRYQPSWNEVAWQIVIFLLGVSELSCVSGLATPWQNEWGDLPVHIGIISSFAKAQNFPPEYILFAGTRLTYPFLFHLWTAIFWWIDSENLYLLRLIFLFQWQLLWSLVFLFLRGKHAQGFAPWLILLGGGSLATLGAGSGQLISEGHPWTVFLTTVWLPQKTFLPGLVLSLAIVRIFLGTLRKRMEFVSLAGFLCGITPLMHGHTWLMTCCFVAGLCLVRREWKTFVMFSIWMWPLIFTLPLLLGKFGMLHLSFGWSVVGKPVFLIQPWFRDIAIWIPLLFMLLWKMRLRQEGGVLLLLFLVFQCVHLCAWEWDQVKFFIAIYAFAVASLSLRWYAVRPIHRMLCVALVIPSILEIAVLFNRGDMFQIYTEQDVAVAAIIEKNTPQDAVIIAPAFHNSAVTLSGRKLFLGYPGTVTSHGLPLESREPLYHSLCPDDFCSVQGAVHHQKRLKEILSGRPVFILTGERRDRIVPLSLDNGIAPGRLSR